MVSARNRERIHRLRYEVRRRVERLDNPQVRDARRLVRAAGRSSPPDVLYLGESTVSFVSVHDTDRRTLFDMVDDGLGPSISMLGVHGGSYHAALITKYLELLEPLPARPTVVVALWVRGRYRAWIDHPVFGHERAMARIGAIEAGTPWWRIRDGWPAPTAADFEAYYGTPYVTLAGPRTVGDYARPLKDPTRWVGRADERSALIHAFHQGAALVAGSAELEAVTEMGAVLRRLGCRVVAYQTPVPVQSGVGHYGPAFAELAAANFAVLDDAFREGIGDDVTILQTGTIFATDEFIDVAGADEHLNQRGRARLAGLIAPAVRSVLVP